MLFRMPSQKRHLCWSSSENIEEEPAEKKKHWPLSTKVHEIGAAAYLLLHGTREYWKNLLDIFPEICTSSIPIQAISFALPRDGYARLDVALIELEAQVFASLCVAAVFACRRIEGDHKWLMCNNNFFQTWQEP